MKTTIDIKDELLIRAKQLAKQSGKPLRAVVEEGLRAALATAEGQERYELPDLSVGNPDDEDPLERFTWKGLRAEIYGEAAET